MSVLEIVTKEQAKKMGVLTTVRTTSGKVHNVKKFTESYSVVVTRCGIWFDGADTEFIMGNDDVTCKNCLNPGHGIFRDMRDEMNDTSW